MILLSSTTRRAVQTPALGALGLLVVAGSVALPATAAHAAPAKPADSPSTRQLSPGVTLSVDGPVRAVTIDPAESDGRLVVSRRSGQLTRTSALTKDVDGLVGVNGSFFAGTGPKGLAASAGRIVGEPTGYGPERTLLVGSDTLRVGKFKSPAALAKVLDSNTSAIAGRFHLLSDGHRAVGTGKGNLYGRHVRTIAGTTGDGRIVMATIGRRVTPTEAAGIAAGLGMTDAINLDGGGSSAMAIRGRLINKAASSERAVADALVWQLSDGPRAGNGGGAKKAPKVKVGPVTPQWWVWYD